MSDSRILVACLCAEWCSVCRDYRSVFDQVRLALPQARFIWVDIEDQSDLVDPVEVDDFPTLLLAVGTEVRFFGAIIPRADRLERLVREQQAQPAVAAAPTPAAAAAPTQALLQRLLTLAT